MKLLSFAISVSRHFSSQAAPVEKKGWNKYNFFKGKKKYGGSFFKTPKKPKIKWTDEQQEVLDAACNGQSVFISGSAGTGKTFLVEHLIKKLKKIHGRSKIYVTASTAVSACALNGQTLHSFAGVGLGDVDQESLIKRVHSDKRALRRWRNVKVLFIDEISMVHYRFFECLACIARTVRDRAEIWGGIQLIVSGDFLQLPPIGKKGKKDEKVYAFEADCWNESFELQIVLTTVFRQSEALLVQLLQVIREGKINPADLKLLEGCCSGLEPDPEAVRLYPMIDDVNRVNKEKLKSLNQEIYVYTAQDSGDKQWMRQLKSGIAQDELELCVGARVMLVKNINPWKKLVNGATGTVLELYKVSDKQYGVSDMCSHGSFLPLVKFDSGLELVVEPETWDVTDGDKVVARRKQVPLILSWGLSIHKCQGMTLKKLVTDLSRVFDYGMVYVALSRVESLDGLCLTGNLEIDRIKAHPKVLEFYNSFNENKKKKVLIGKGGEIDEGDKIKKNKVLIGKESETNEVDLVKGCDKPTTLNLKSTRSNKVKSG